MNIFILILLIASLIGFIDLVFDLKLDLKDEFKSGMATIGSLTISMLGILTVGVVFIQNHIELITQCTSFLPFDSSLLFSILLAPDMGGFSISNQIAASTKLLFLNGVLLSSILGQTISFQIPVFIGSLPDQEQKLLFQSFMLGMIAIPIGLLFGGICIQLPFDQLILNGLPVLLLCGVIALMMKRFPNLMNKVFMIFAKIIQYITYLLFLIAVVGYLFPQFAYVSNELLADTMLTLLRIGLIVSGSLVISKLVLKYLNTPIKLMADKLGINEVSMIGLILNCATSLAMLPLYTKMDKKGKMINGAFSVSGAYLIGGQLAFISSQVSGSIITIYILTKLLCGIISIGLVLMTCRKEVE